MKKMSLIEDKKRKLSESGFIPVYKPGYKPAAKAKRVNEHEELLTDILLTRVAFEEEKTKFIRELTEALTVSDPQILLHSEKVKNDPIPRKTIQIYNNEINNWSTGITFLNKACDEKQQLLFQKEVEKKLQLLQKLKVVLELHENSDSMFRKIFSSDSV